MLIPLFPDFIPISLDLKSDMHPKLSLAPDGVSEFTFAGLYLFRNRYKYRISRLEDDTLVISGVQPPHTELKSDIVPEGETPEPLSPFPLSFDSPRNFFMTPCGAPGRDVLKELFRTHDYWKNIPKSVLIPGKEQLEEWGIKFTEDRDNFDYLYLRTDLAELAGKKYHKKRNLVAQFLKLYSHDEKPLTQELIPQALEVLEQWCSCKINDSDCVACREALELFGELNMKGQLFYIDGKPAGWCLGESLARDNIFAIHFEKGLDGYKGIYQFINQTFAASLPENFTYINREQDLGDDGLRQAKMTYRPSGFVRKYIGLPL